MGHLWDIWDTLVAAAFGAEAAQTAHPQTPATDEGDKKGTNVPSPDAQANRVRNPSHVRVFVIWRDIRRFGGYRFAFKVLAHRIISSISLLETFSFWLISSRPASEQVYFLSPTVTTTM